MTMTRNGIPIACNLGVFSAAELEAHVSLALELLFQRPKHTQELPDGFLFEYEGNNALFMDLARFVYNEHRCCPWESFAIELEPFLPDHQGTLRLRYSAGLEAKPILAQALERFQQAASDPAARQRLLAALRGPDEITPENKDALHDRLSAPTTTEVEPGCAC